MSNGFMAWIEFGTWWREGEVPAKYGMARWPVEVVWDQRRRLTLKEGGLPSGNILAVKDLLSAIDNDRQPECSIYEARLTIEMISAVFESHRVGGPVTFPLKTRENPLSLL